jgi:phosphomannomutase
MADLFSRARAWRDGDPDAETVAELDRLIAGGAGTTAELAERFAGPLEFGTAGLRGIIGAGESRMNRAVVRRATAGLARYLLDQVPHVKQRGVVVGRDGRRLSRELAADTAAVLAAHGIPALVFSGVVPTPLVAFAVLHTRAAAAVMVTASHNPPEYNGYKVYWGNGAQIVPPHDTGIAAAIDTVGPAREVPLLGEGDAREKGLWRDLPLSVAETYLAAIAREQRHAGPAGHELGIVYTAMHGVGGHWVLEALDRAGFGRVYPVREQQEPDGAFPTVHFPNPEEPGALDLALALAARHHADIILANDPDADRLAVVARDASGALQPLTGNETGVILGHYTLTQSQPRPAHPFVVTTIVSSPQLGVIARDLGAAYDETLTGFKWIANRALARSASEPLDFLFGYEEAIGYTVGTVARDKDGVGSALVMADCAAWCHARGTTLFGYLEEIHRAHGLFVATQKNYTFSGTEGGTIIRAIMNGFRERQPTSIGGLAVSRTLDYQAGVGDLPPSNVIAFELDGGSRVTLRPSGTEPKIKYYVDLRQSVAAGEDFAAARSRALAALGKLADAVVALAHERGQPR